MKSRTAIKVCLFLPALNASAMPRVLRKIPSVLFGYYKAGIKLRFAFQVFCSVGASWISRRRRNFPNVDKFSAHHFKNMQISSEGYEIVMQFA